MLYMTLSQGQRNFLANTADTGFNDGPVMNLLDAYGLIGLLANWVLAQDSQIVWTPDTLAPAAGLRSATASLAVQNAGGFTDFFNEYTTVTATITGGTATGKALNGSASPAILTMVDGVASLLVSATGAGTVTVGLSAPTPAGLTVTDVLTVTFS